MDSNSVQCLVNSISRFILLVTSQSQKPLPVLNDFKNITNLLKLLKQVLDEVSSVEAHLDEDFNKICEELDVVINEARDFVEEWSPKISKICSVVWSYRLLNRIQDVSTKLCLVLSRLPQSSSPPATNLQKCLQEFQSLKMESLQELVEEALKNQRNKITLNPETLLQIIKILNLTPGHELIKESLAVEKERLKAQVSKTKSELDQINQIVDLLSSIREVLLQLDCFQNIDGVAIPTFFRCPLSLELMVNPMIVASGQTFEKTSIQKWLDQGLNICPKTRQVLPHLSFIPNYTVKSMIANWCNEKKLKLSEASKVVNVIVLPSSSALVGKDLLSSGGSGSASNCDSSTSQPLTEVCNGLEQQKTCDSQGVVSVDESKYSENNGSDKLQDQRTEQSYTHSRSESAASDISSVGCSMPVTSARDFSIRNEITEFSGEISSAQSATPARDLGDLPLLGERQYQSSKTMSEITQKGGNINCARVLSFPLSDNSNVDTVITTSQAEKLVEDLTNQSNDVKTTAAAELRLLTKHNAENRAIAGRCGAIQPLITLLYSEVKLTQEHAVTALLNLSLDEKNKTIISDSGALDPLIHVLETGSAGAKENTAAALFSLSVLEDYKAKIGRSGAIKSLVNLLANGTLRGKKDAATALFNLSIFHENKARIVKADAVKHLVHLMEPSTGMVDKSVALLANLATISEGCTTIVREGGIPSIVEVAETGSQRSKENATCILLQLCLENSKFCTLVLQEGAVPPLVAISQTGTPRAREKAQQLLSHFRSQREGKKGRN